MPVSVDSIDDPGIWAPAQHSPVEARWRGKRIALVGAAQPADTSAMLVKAGAGTRRRKPHAGGFWITWFRRTSGGIDSASPVTCCRTRPRRWQAGSQALGAWRRGSCALPAGHGAGPVGTTEICPLSIAQLAKNLFGHSLCGRYRAPTPISFPSGSKDRERPVRALLRANWHWCACFRCLFLCNSNREAHFKALIRLIRFTIILAGQVM